MKTASLERTVAARVRHARRWHGWAVGGVGALLCAVVSSVAHAEPTLPSDVRARPPERTADLSNERRAEELFHAGEKKFDSGDSVGACADFSQSLQLGPKLGTLLNLALCHETTGKLVTAWHEFAHAAAWAAQNNQRDRHDFATQHVRALEPKLPRVVLQLPADRPIDGLDLDGDPLPETSWYLPLYLDAGEHRLALTAPGKKRTTVAFRVSSSPSDQVVYVPKLADDLVRVLPPPPTDSTRLTLGTVGLGLGLTGAIVGTTFGVLAATGDDGDPAVRERATAAVVASGTGLLLATIGGWLVWTSRAPRAASVGVAPRASGAAFSFASVF